MKPQDNLTPIEEDNLIPIDLQLENFKTYLDTYSRTIFSAKFGDGKSYFLSRFIEENQKDYLFIPIYPVNYQVADNKDIFDYIKRDILIRLLMTDGVKIDDTDISTSLKLWNFVSNNKLDILTDICQVLPEINMYGVQASLGKVLTAIKTISDKYETYNTKFTHPEQKAGAFISAFENQKGSIYEFDYISQLICEINEQYRKDNPNKKIVLIIEDLDRIDPSHIFRILNIFSAHFDNYNIALNRKVDDSRDNKFGFDKIVTVCDYQNIEYIYAHFYGTATDFNGYIHKFSQGDPFKYSLADELEKYIFENLHPALKQYPTIREALAKQIIAVNFDPKIAKTKAKSSIRTIKANLKSEPLIKKVNLVVFRLINDDCIHNSQIDFQVRSKNPNHETDFKKMECYTNSYNNFTILLDIISRFNVSFDQIVIVDNEKLVLELAKLIHHLWLLDEISNNEILEINGFKELTPIDKNKFLYPQNRSTKNKDNRVVLTYSIGDREISGVILDIYTALTAKKNQFMAFIINKN